MKLNLLLIGLLFLLLMGCAQNTVISRNYDFTQMKRVGITRFPAPRNVKGIEDLFSKQLMAQGFDVVDKNRINAIFKDNNIGKINYAEFKKVNEGMENKVDVLLTGEISYYKPSKEVIGMVETQDISVDDGTTLISSKRASDGSVYTRVDKDPKMITTEIKTTPTFYNTSTEMGAIVKLIDLKTLDVIWIGSVTKSGRSTLAAEENVVKYLVKKMTKDIKSVLKK